MPVGGFVVESSCQPAQFGGEHQPHRHRRAVAPAVALAPLDGVRQRVAVIEDLAQLRFLLVGGDDFGFDGHRAPNQFRQHLPGRIERRLRVGLDEVEDRRVGDESRLDDLGHAGHDLVARQRLQCGQVDQDGCGLVERADQILARVGVDAGLAADGRVHHGQQRGGHVHDVHAAQPGGGREPGHVGGRSTAQADDRVLAPNPDAAQHLPDEADDGQFLARLGVGEFDAVGVDSLVGQMVSDGFGGLRQHGLVQNGDLVATARGSGPARPAARCR